MLVATVRIHDGRCTAGDHLNYVVVIDPPLNSYFADGYHEDCHGVFPTPEYWGGAINRSTFRPALDVLTE